VSACAAGARISAAWEHTHIEGEFSGNRSDQPANSTSARRQSVTLGFVLSAQHLSDRSAAVARPKAGYPAAGHIFYKTVCAAAGKIRARDFAGSVPKVARLFVAGERARITERDGIRGGAGAAKRCQRKRIARGIAVAGGVATD